MTEEKFSFFPIRRLAWLLNIDLQHYWLKGIDLHIIFMGSRSGVSILNLHPLPVLNLIISYTCTSWCLCCWRSIFLCLIFYLILKRSKMFAAICLISLMLFITKFCAVYWLCPTCSAVGNMCICWTVDEYFGHGFLSLVAFVQVLAFVQLLNESSGILFSNSLPGIRLYCRRRCKISLLNHLRTCFLPSF